MSDIMLDPTRIFNTDETCIQLCPKSGKVLGFRGWKNIYEVAAGPEKSNLTFLGTFSASGEVVAPMLIYPYVRLPEDIVCNVPDEFYIGRSDSGWMKSETFYEFIANAFNPWLIQSGIKKPVILFVDGHRTHLSMSVSELCDEVDIILYLLPPNTTHILQPADVGPFKPLKSFWKTAVGDFQRENTNAVVRRQHVAPLLLKVLKQISASSIINGFKATGIYPLDPDRVDYSKCLEIETIGDTGDDDTSEGHTTLGDTRENTVNTIPLIDIQTTFKTVKILLGKSISDKCESQNQSVGKTLRDLYTTLRNKSIGATLNINEASNDDQSSSSTERNLDNYDLPEISVFSDVLIGDETEAPVFNEPQSNDLDLDRGISLGTTTDSLFNLPEIGADDLNDCSILSISMASQGKSAPIPGTTENNQVVSTNAGPVDSNTSIAHSGETSNAFVTITTESLQKYNYYPEKIVHKKKPPTERIQYVINAKDYRKSNEIKNRKRNKDWVCKYCTDTYSSDKKNKVDRLWIECDKCSKQMHQLCISDSHREKFNLDIVTDDGNVEFSCDECV